jgi:hypothetical protein
MLHRTTRRIAFHILALAFFFAALPLFAAPAAVDQGGDRLARGIQMHNAINAGDDSQIEAALSLLGSDGWDRPNLALAYHGSVLTLEAAKAKKEGKLLTALGLLNAGVKEIDEALRRDPTMVELHILRMENSMALVETSPVNRKKEAGEDIDFLRGQWNSLGAEWKATVELDSGRLALANKHINEALSSWRKATQEAPLSDAANRAKKLLERYGD